MPIYRPYVGPPAAPTAPQAPTAPLAPHTQLSRPVQVFCHRSSDNNSAIETGTIFMYCVDRGDHPHSKTFNRTEIHQL